MPFHTCTNSLRALTVRDLQRSLEIPPSKVQPPLSAGLSSGLLKVKFPSTEAFKTTSNIHVKSKCVEAVPQLIQDEFFIFNIYCDD